MKTNFNQTTGDRFTVALTTAKGVTVVCKTTNDAVEAMNHFLDLSDSDFGKLHGLGSNVALTDNQLTYDAGSVADGIGTRMVKVAKVEGRLLLDELRIQRQVARDKANGK